MKTTEKIEKYLNEKKSNREKIAREAWKKYHSAIKKHDLDNIQDRNHQGIIDYMYDAFFAGFYANDE